MNTRENILNIISQMSLRQKFDFLCGSDSWHIREDKALNLKPIAMSDGPHGLRIVDSFSLEEGETAKKASLFPCAALMACSFDPDSLYQVGKAIGKEANLNKVSIVLGPGINIKRNPLCGRNFEYYSEDPVLSGNLASGFINGLQSENVGACIKHFAANSQETNRMISDSIIDEKTLFDIYLKGFEIAINQSNPECIMGSYNKINGIYGCENQFLINFFLREKLHYEGLFMTDWGAMNDRIAAYKATCSLEMPFYKRNFNLFLKAIKKNKINIEEIDRAVFYVIKESYKHQNDVDKLYDNFIYKNNYNIARNVASNSIVLAKNEDNILPLNNTEKVLFCGPFIEELRNQGHGSSNINSYYEKNILDVLKERKLNYSYLNGDLNSNEYIISLLQIASSVDKVVLFLGTNPNEDSEGFDRTSLLLPKEQINLVSKILSVNKNCIININSGSVVEIPYLKEIKGVTISYFGGEAYSDSIIDILYGIKNPSGHLAETWIQNISQSASSDIYPGKELQVRYKECCFVGYRNTESLKENTAFSFGHGLSYSNFEYSKFEIQKYKNNEFRISFDVKNISNIDGSTVLQLYISDLSNNIIKPIFELKQFKKLFVKSNSTVHYTFTVKDNDFSTYVVEEKNSVILQGKYKLLIGLSSNNIIYSTYVTVDGLSFNQNCMPFLTTTSSIKKQIDTISDEEFDKYANYINSNNNSGVFTLNSTLEDIKNTWIGKLLIKKATKVAQKMQTNDLNFYEMYIKSLYSTPLRTLANYANLSERQAKAIVLLANGKTIKGLITFIF